MTKKYRLLQDYKVPNMEGRLAGEVKTSLEWLRIFYARELPSYYDAHNSDKYCDEYPSWFAPEPPKHPTKEEIIEEVKRNTRAAGWAFTFDDVITKCLKTTMEKHEQSIIGQLIEKIEKIDDEKLVGSGAYDPMIKCGIRTTKSEIIEILRNFKSE